MKILSIEDATRMLMVDNLDTYVNQLKSRLRRVGGTFTIPPDSGRKTALSRLFANLLLKKSSVCLYVDEWGVWPSCEHLDLFYGYRRSLGETRPLIEAPFHVFERTEYDALISMMSMVLYFVWGAWIFDIEGKTLIRISHDEWLEIGVGDEETHQEFTAEMERYELPARPRGQQSPTAT